MQKHTISQKLFDNCTI